MKLLYVNKVSPKLGGGAELRFKLFDPTTALFGFLSQYLLKVFAFDGVITVNQVIEASKLSK